MSRFQIYHRQRELKIKKSFSHLKLINKGKMKKMKKLMLKKIMK